MPLTSWKVLGAVSIERCDEEHLEGGIRAGNEARVRSPPTRVTARSAGGSKSRALGIDYRRVLDVDGAAVGFGFCEFYAKKSGWVRFGFASADGMKAWLNDEVILERPGASPHP